MNIQNMKEVFESNHFEFIYFETACQATDYIKSNIQNKKVSFGGSMTLDKMGVYEELSQNNEVHWHAKIKGDYTQVADVYLTSANAIAETGEIVNIDGRGNRVSAAIYGCRQVFVVCGTNKVTPDLTSALDRAKNIAAPLNAKRLERKTPCAIKGDKCYNCKSEERICCATTIVNFKPIGSERYVVILIGEDLGL